MVITYKSSKGRFIAAVRDALRIEEERSLLAHFQVYGRAKAKSADPAGITTYCLLFTSKVIAAE